MKRVLIVDDGVFMRTLIKGLLTKNGYEIVGEAEDGLIAIEKFKELKPDLVTMDITMPNMDGLASLKEIMKIDADANVVMISAIGQEEAIKDAIISGAKGFIVKPFDENELVSIIEGI